MGEGVGGKGDCGGGGGWGRAYAALQTILLHMKRLNKTESPIFGFFFVCFCYFSLLGNYLFAFLFATFVYFVRVLNSPNGQNKLTCPLKHQLKLQQLTVFNLRANKALHFNRIVCFSNPSIEISSHIFFERTPELPLLENMFFNRIVCFSNPSIEISSLIFFERTPELPLLENMCLELNVGVSETHCIMAMFSREPVIWQH